MVDTIKKSDASLAEALMESNAALTTFGENLCKSIEVLAKSMAGSSSQHSQSGYNPYLMDYAPGRSNFTSHLSPALIHQIVQMKTVFTRNILSTITEAPGTLQAKNKSNTANIR